MTSLPAAQEIEKLRSALAEQIGAIPEGKILGAQLGSRLNRLLAPNTYKAWLGDGSQNLRAFTETFLKGVVSSTDERQGNDHVFRVEISTQEVNQTFGGALWKAFCVANPAMAIYYDDAQTRLFLLPIAGSEVPATRRLLSLTQAELKEMTVEFVGVLQKQGRATTTLREIAKAFEPRSYSVWVTALKAEAGLFKEWGEFRVDRVKKAFARRTETLVQDETVRTRLQREFEADYQSQKVTSLVTTPQTAASAVPLLVARTSDQSSRHALIRAIESLDESQLKQIMVPLDLVAVLLAQRKL